MTSISESTASFTGSKDLRIFYRCLPAADERARIVIAHGLGEHCGRYQHVMEMLAGNGLSVWALDHRGHGQSDGNRGHIDSFDQYIQDLRQLIEIARKDLPENRKCFLLGHSMGGLLVLNFAYKHARLIDGVIASSPGLAPAQPPSRIKSALGSIMSVLRPKLAFDNELDSRFLSHDAEVLAAYDNDPLVHQWVTARWFTQYLNAMKETMDAAPAIKTPILMQVAGVDHLVNPQASRQFFEKLSLADKKLCFYDGLYHEIYNEVDKRRENVLNDLENWLMEHI